MFGMVAGGMILSMDTPRKEQLKNSGLFGEHSLVRTKSFTATHGSVSGSFFLGIGSIGGSLDSEFRIRFYWSPRPGEVMVTTLPYDKLLFIIDETKETPTVEFMFTEYWLNSGQGIGDYSREKHLNSNEFVLLDEMKLVRVKISSKAMKKEIYLPKLVN